MDVGVWLPLWMILSIPPGFHCNAFLRVLIEKILFLVLSVEREREKISLFTPELRKFKQFSARVDFGKILTHGNGTNAATNQTENGFKIFYIPKPGLHKLYISEPGLRIFFVPAPGFRIFYVLEPSLIIFYILEPGFDNILYSEPSLIIFYILEPVFDNILYSGCCPQVCPLLCTNETWCAEKFKVSENKVQDYIM